MDRDPSINWQVVKAELDEIDEVWKQARFDSLPHVVEILTSQVPEEEIERLREQRNAIEDLVDDVVRGYHSGFNKAFHNYSQILKFFGDSTSSIDSLKKDLEKSKELLGSRNKHLQQLWYRSLTLRHVISLLDQIENVSQVPSRIERLIATKQYYAAVQLYLQSTSLIDREGLDAVGALQDVRSDLSKRRGTLFFKVVDELHLHIYGKGEYSAKPILDCEANDDISTIPMANGISSNGAYQRRKENGSLLFDGNKEDGAIVEGAARDNWRWRTGLPSWLADSTPNEFVDRMTKKEAPLHVKYMETMVECLVLLGKVAAAGAILSQKLRPTVHELITEDIKARAAAIDASRPRVDQVLKTVLTGSKTGKHMDSIIMSLKDSSVQHKTSLKGSLVMRQSAGLITVSRGPMGPGQTVAQSLLESILRNVSQILENHVFVGELMEAKSIILNEMSSPTTSNGNLNWNADPDVARATGGYSVSFALTVIQSEIQQLICDILRATPDAATADAAVQTARLATKLPLQNSRTNGVVEEGLSFAFRFTDTVFSSSGGDGLRQFNSRRNVSGNQEGYGTAAVLPDRGIHLIGAVYRPVLQFADKVLHLLPPKYSQLGNDGLQSFIENFVKDQFLPPVRVDYRNRVQDALASPAAFRPKSRTGLPYETSIEKGRPVLQGPSAASELANEVVSWAQAMPKYAGDFVEVSQALLERTLERCRASYTEAVLGSLSSSIVGRSDFENLMRQEPASRLLNMSYLEKLDMKLSEDLYDPEVEKEIQNLLISQRPVKEEQLIGDDHKLVLLAALSDSLDYVSEAIERLGQNTSTSGSGKKKDSQHVYHHRRTSSALTSSLSALAEKYQSLSAECLRTLRIEMQLIALFHTQCMTQRGYMLDQDAEEPEEFIFSLTMQITRLDEEMIPYIPEHKRKYIFGGVSGLLATFFIKALPDIGKINIFGIRQICQNCIGVEQAFAALSSSNSSIVQQQLEPVRNYYELLNLPFEALLAYISEHSTAYRFPEYAGLLKVNVPNREVPLDGVQRVAEIVTPGF